MKANMTVMEHELYDEAADLMRQLELNYKARANIPQNKNVRLALRRERAAIIKLRKIITMEVVEHYDF